MVQKALIATEELRMIFISNLVAGPPILKKSGPLGVINYEGDLANGTSGWP